MNSFYNLILEIDDTHIGDDFCSDEKVMAAIRVLGYFIYILKIFIPFIIIIFGTFDLYKAVMGADEKSISKSVKSLGLRFLIGFAVFLIPTIIDVIFNFANGYSDIKSDLYICETCLLKPFECEDGLPEDTNPIDDLFEDEVPPVDNDLIEDEVPPVDNDLLGDDEESEEEEVIINP